MSLCLRQKSGDSIPRIVGNGWHPEIVACAFNGRDQSARYQTSGVRKHLCGREFPQLDLPDQDHVGLVSPSAGTSRATSRPARQRPSAVCRGTGGAAVRFGLLGKVFRTFLLRLIPTANGLHDVSSPSAMSRVSGSDRRSLGSHAPIDREAQIFAGFERWRPRLPVHVFPALRGGLDREMLAEPSDGRAPRGGVD